LELEGFVCSGMDQNCMCELIVYDCDDCDVDDRALKKLNPDIILTSGLERIPKSFQDRVLQKPFHPRELVEKIRNSSLGI